jgi:hypothetical protein
VLRCVHCRAAPPPPRAMHSRNDSAKVCVSSPHAFPHHTRALHQERNEERAQRARVVACMPSLDTYAELKARGMARPPDVAEGQYPQFWDVVTAFPLDKDGNFVFEGVFALAIMLDPKKIKKSIDAWWFFDNSIRGVSTRTSHEACTALFVRGLPHASFVDRSHGYPSDFYADVAHRVIDRTVDKIRAARPRDAGYEVEALVAYCYTSTLPVSTTIELVMPPARVMNVIGVFDPVTFIHENECVRVAIPERALDAYDSD